MYTVSHLKQINFVSSSFNCQKNVFQDQIDQFHIDTHSNGFIHHKQFVLPMLNSKQSSLCNQQIKRTYSQKSLHNCFFQQSNDTILNEETHTKIKSNISLFSRTNTVLNFTNGINKIRLGQCSLFDLLREKKYFTEVETFYYITQAIKALLHMHEHGIIHRDIKPQNIVLVHNVVQLADFGWSIFIGQNSKRNTFCGTLDYFSPQIIMDDEYDYMIDVWGIGVLAINYVLDMHLSPQKTIVQKLTQTQ